MSVVSNTKWSTQNIDHSLPTSDQFGIETVLEITDIDSIIYELSVTNPEGKSKTVSFCSFNHNHPKPDDESFKILQNKLTIQLINQLCKEYPSDDMTYADKASYQSRFEVKLDTMKSGYYQWSKDEINKEYNNRAFIVRKNMMLWFWQHGKKMFDYHLINTSKQLAFGQKNGIITHRSYIVQAFWIFPWNKEKTSYFFLDMINILIKKKILYHLYELKESRLSYYWIPRDYNTDIEFILKNRRTLVIQKLYLVMYNVFSKNYERMALEEIILNILTFLSVSDIDFIIDLFNQSKYKLAPTVDNMIQLSLSVIPVTFFQNMYFIQKHANEITVLKGKDKHILMAENNTKFIMIN